MSRGVKDAVYKVARRYATRVKVVANATLRVPDDPLVELILCAGFGAVDDWIAENAGPADIVITADIPLAARCLAKGAITLSPQGLFFTDYDIGEALAMRGLMDELRQSGLVTGGPAPMTPKDGSRFMSKLDEAVNAVRAAPIPRKIDSAHAEMRGHRGLSAENPACPCAVKGDVLQWVPFPPGNCCSSQ